MDGGLQVVDIISKVSPYGNGATLNPAILNTTGNSAVTELGMVRIMRCYRYYKVIAAIPALIQ